MNLEKEREKPEIQGDKLSFIPPTSLSEAIQIIEELRKRDMLPEKLGEDLCNT